MFFRLYHTASVLFAFVNTYHIAGVDRRSSMSLAPRGCRNREYTGPRGSWEDHSKPLAGRPFGSSKLLWRALALLQWFSGQPQA
ncbi:Glucokinase regulatory protein [Manis javanica]|nr:Glucokinase regulatory protein [Manis javanica]